MENPEFFTLLNERDARFKKIETAIEQLNEAQKTCIDLFYFQRKSYQQIAAITGYSVKQVKSNIQNGKKNLQKMFVKQEAIKNVGKS
ncbi:MAG TPA: sigma-70 family RNA polymerase sigma factor [bacterium]